MTSPLADEVRAIATAGIAAQPHRYDAERYEEIAKLADHLDREGEPFSFTSSIAALEALAKTGWSLTGDEAERARYAELVTLAERANDGRAFFGPATAPRTSIDDRLDSISSRYVTPKTGVNAVVDDGSGRLLMVQRADRGQWCIPGGYADVGLSGAEVAVKETLEETGFEVEVVALLGEWNNLQHAGQQIPQYSLLYHCWVTGGSEKRHETETLDLQWFKRGEVPSSLWQDGDPWLEISLRAVEGVKQAPYFDRPRNA